MVLADVVYDDVKDKEEEVAVNDLWCLKVVAIRRNVINSMNIRFIACQAVILCSQKYEQEEIYHCLYVYTKCFPLFVSSLIFD
jgi:hypothetical protein